MGIKVEVTASETCGSGIAIGKQVKRQVLGIVILFAVFQYDATHKAIDLEILFQVTVYVYVSTKTR